MDVVCEWRLCSYRRRPYRFRNAVDEENSPFPVVEEQGIHRARPLGDVIAFSRSTRLTG